MPRKYMLSGFVILILIAFGWGGYSVTAQTPPATLIPEATIESKPDGSPLKLVWQTGGSPDDILFTPDGVSVDSQGNIYVTEYGAKNAIKKFDSNGKFVASYGTFGSDDDQFTEPLNVVADSQGNIYAVDAQKIAVLKLDSSGKFLTRWSTEPPDGPSGMAVDSEDNIYVANHRTHDHYIQKFDSNGNLLAEWGATGIGDGQFNAGASSGPEELKLDPNGNVYVTDPWNDRVEKFDADGRFVANFDAPGDGRDKFNFPWGVGVDGQGNIYINDNSFIEKFDPNGKFLTEWSVTSGDLVQSSIGQMTVDAQGNIYVFAYGNVYSTALKKNMNLAVLKKFAQS